VRDRLGTAGAIVAALVGAVANFITVIVVGIVRQSWASPFVQQSWASPFVRFAFEAGLAFLIAVVIVIPPAHRLVKPAVALTPGS
jgi:hypothetical protein